MNWIVKAKRPSRIVAEWLQEGTADTWWTARRLKRLRPDDRLFFWKGGGAPYLIGVGQCLSVSSTRNMDGLYTFRVRYFTDALPPKLTITMLRRDSAVGNASFLKVGPSGTLHAITEKQGKRLETLIKRFRLHDGEFSTARISGGKLPAGLESVQIGETKLAIHYRKERSRALREAKLGAAARNGAMRCEVCELSFGSLPRDLVKACCEVHHKVPMAILKEGMLVKLSDLAVVCSNCHRMIHFKNPPLTIKKLKKQLGLT